MLTFTLAISCLPTSSLPWFMDLTFQVPMQYCSWQHPTLVLSPVISTTGWYFCFGSVSSFFLEFSQFSSVAQSCPTLCDPMNHSTPGLPVHHQLPEFTQIHVHQVSDAIQPSHPPSSPSPSAFNLSQHQGLFQWVNSSHEVAKVLEFQL